MNVVFLGPPGAGKGTQAVGVAEGLNIKHISTGDMFRASIRNGTRLGLKVKEITEQGLLVPDSIVIEMVAERLDNDDCDNGYLLDGFPRTVEQAIALESISAPDVVVDIDVPDEALITRLAGRRVCSQCRGTFHTSRLKDEKVCPTCGGELIHRIDDHNDTIVSRLKVYHDSTEPLLRYYEDSGKLMVIDGNRTPEAVTHEILKSLGIA